MGLKNVRSAGPNFAPAYQVSGIPFATSSAPDEVPVASEVNGSTVMPIQVKFNYATRFFVVTNNGDFPLRVGFTQLGIQTPGVSSKPANLDANYFLVPASSSSPRIEARCKELYFLSDGDRGGEHAGQKGQFSLLAGLSMIQEGEFPILTGSISRGLDSVGNEMVTASFKGVG